MAIRYLSGVNIDSNTLFVDDVNNRVGIGTGNPTYQLHVTSSSAALGVYERTGGASLYLEGQSTRGVIGTVGNHDLLFAVNSLERFRVDTSGNVGIGTTSPSYKTSVVASNGNYWNGTAFTGTPLALSIENSQAGGYDPVLIYNQADSGGTLKNSGAIGMIGTAPWTAGDNALQVSDMYFLVRNSSGGISERLRIKSTGAAQLKAYGSGSFTGTVAYNLAVDSSGNIIETAGGVVDGSGTANYVSKWSDANTLTDSQLFDNGTNVGIGTTGPNTKLEVNSGAGAGSTDLLSLARSAGYGATVFNQTYDSTYFANGKTLTLKNDSTTAFAIFAGNNAGTVTNFYLPTGNIGIGLSSASAPLTIQSDSGAAAMRLRGRAADSISSIDLYNNAESAGNYIQSNGTWIRARADGGFHFADGATPTTTATDAFSINGMNVLIGTTTDVGHLLYVNGTSRFNGVIHGSTRLMVGITSDQTYASIFVGGDITTGGSQYALLLDPQLSGTNNYGLLANARIKASHAATNAYGVYVVNNETLSGASIVNNYGLYIADQTRGSSVNYALYSAGGTSYFAGNVLIGTTTDGGYKLRVNGTGRYDDYLQLWSGTAGASPRLIFGGETSSTDKSIFLESYYMVFQGHNNEGFKFQTTASTGAISNRMSILGTGTIVFSDYGSGTKTGTVAYNLAVDSSGNIIETAGGVVDGSGTANYVAKWQDANTVTDSQIVDNGTNVGINNASPKTKLDVNGTIGFGGKNMSMTDTFADALTLNMNDHNGCYVKLTAFGDWGNHSTIAYLGEFFIQASAGSYNEPGIIIRQVDNTAGGDDIQAQIVDPAGTGTRDFVIQLKATSASNTPFTAYLQYEVRGLYNSVS